MKHQLVVRAGGAPRGRRAPRGLLRLNKHMVLDFLPRSPTQCDARGWRATLTPTRDSSADTKTIAGGGEQRLPTKAPCRKVMGNAGPVFAGSAVCGERPSNKSPALGRGRQRGHACEPRLANDSGTEFTDGG